MNQPHRHRSDRTTSRSGHRTDLTVDGLDTHRLAADNDGLGHEPDQHDEPYEIDLGGVPTASSSHPVPAGNQKTLKSRLVSLGTGAVLGLVAAVPIIVFAVVPYKNRAESNEATASPPETTSETAATGAGNDAAPSTTILEPPAAGPYVLAVHDADGLHLTGTVPDEATSTAVLSAAQRYAPDVASELHIDATQPPADWLTNAPDVLTLLSRAISGTALIADGTVRLVVQAPAARIAERIERDIADATGLPVVTEHADITGQQPPVLEISGTVGQLQLRGRVPTDEIRQAALTAATDVYGQGNVTSQLTVDETAHTALWTRDPNGLFESLAVYPEVELAISGETTTGFVRGGYTFQSGSADAVPTSDGVIGFAVDLMNRDPLLIMVIQAHTDPDGPDDANQALSQQRADTVAAYYTDAGVAAGRITAVGKGATELLTEDTTPQGKDRNRRIDVLFSTT